MNVKCELPHLACSVYYSTLQDMPAMVRLWWNSQEKRVSAVVEKFTVKYISPVLSAQEISSVQSSNQLSDSMTVSCLSIQFIIYSKAVYFDAAFCLLSFINLRSVPKKSQSEKRNFQMSLLLPSNLMLMTVFRLKPVSVKDT